MTDASVIGSRPNKKRRSSPYIYSSVEEIRRFSRDMKAGGKKIGLVPTMGALHDGHLSLIEKARELADITIVTIFINPRQFGKNEDLSVYPRQIEKDVDMIDHAGGHAVFTPATEEIYPPGYVTNIHVKDITQGLCGASRPGHFDGVATIVTKLLIMTEPDIAIFGEKDYQQLCVIKRLVKDLNIDCDIYGAPIMRDKYGLALSSRNAYLTPEELDIARQFNKILIKAKEGIEKGEAIEKSLSNARTELLASGVDDVDYIEFRDGDTLEPLSDFTQEGRLLAAIKIGKARLIDNFRVTRSR